MNYSVTAVYFSPTDTSRRGVCAMAEVLGGEFSELDLTHGAAEANFGEQELVIFGGPVYGGRLYKGQLERMAGLKGNNTPCVLTVTYGNRHYDDALLELYDWAKEHGFVPVAAATLIGQHTYGAIQVGRPNDDDLAEDAAFAEKIKAKLETGDLSSPEIPGNRPYKDGGTGGKFRPQTDDNCVLCGLCAMECPMQAIGTDFRTIDDSKCIACFQCIRRCPMGAKNMNAPAYNEFAAMFTERLKERRENEYFI